MREIAMEARRFASVSARVPVVGTQSYQAAIGRVVGPPTPPPDSRARWHGEAALEPEPENRHDPGAVRVAVDGETVGYLARPLAERLQPALLALARRGERVLVPAYARGGFPLPDGTRATVGLVLRFDADELAAASS